MLDPNQSLEVQLAVLIRDVKELHIAFKEYAEASKHTDELQWTAIRRIEDKQKELELFKKDLEEKYEKRIKNGSMTINILSFLLGIISTGVAVFLAFQ